MIKFEIVNRFDAMRVFDITEDLLCGRSCCRQFCKEFKAFWSQTLSCLVGAEQISSIYWSIHEMLKKSKKKLESTMVEFYAKQQVEFHWSLNLAQYA